MDPAMDMVDLTGAETIAPGNPALDYRLT